MNNPTTMPYYHYFPFVGDMAEKEEPTFDPDLEGRPRRNLTKKKDLQRGASDDTELANEYILPNANNLSSLKKPPLEYESIRKEDWKSFVDKILSEAFQMEIDRRSPNKVTPKSVTNNPKATPKSVTNNPKATPKLVTNNNPKATPKSVTKRKVDGRRSPTNAVVYLYEQKRTTKEPVVVKPVTARKLVLRKNTRGAVKARKENKSS
ncbi:hypothetical protein CUMW_176490 [Citrus unshiu]|uniref:Uncharacterized protein n=1 Tax=Citrus unshiu TaxID=55188 RepID=A0A2H5PXG2_CITUN|nr:hypothetical protein CUMW_176490 [Citrus unshiu]